MVSVLIPIFNYDVTGLVTSLISQLSIAKIDYEIICIDDASTNYCVENDKLKLQNNVILNKLTANVGRSKIRNLLAKKAKYNWLLFLDSDVLPSDNFFVKTYLKYVNNNHEKVFCGGIIYQENKPEKSKILRWKYGKQREEVSALVRQEKPYRYFFGANCLIHKSIFKQIVFNENLSNYGYEDLLFIESARVKNISVFHIDNPVLHLGIEVNALFLNKTKSAIRNLVYMYNHRLIEPKYLKILKVIFKLEQLKMMHLFGNFYLLFKPLFEYNLKSKTPFLWVFDLFKLTYFCHIKTEAQIKSL